MRAAGFKLFPDEVTTDDIGDHVCLWTVDARGKVDRVDQGRTADEFRAALSCTAPMPFGVTRAGKKYRQIYLFGQRLWHLLPGEEALSPDELRLVFLQSQDADRRKFDRLKSKFSGQAGEPVYKREPIAEEVQIFVWRRDDGRCVKCGERENLEFDHIIPVSRGGSNTGRNIQLLCEGCNREKSNHIGG